MKSIFPPKAELLAEYHQARDRLEKAIPEMVYSHNDLHIKNMIFNPEECK